MEEEVGLPKATISKLIRENLPEHRLSADLCDKLLECCTEFINLVASEANDVCSKESKNTIHPEHVVQALSELQFTEFVPAVSEAWEKYKEENKIAANKQRLSKKQAANQVGMSEEEQIALQQQMFAAARARSMGEGQLEEAAMADASE
uniref:Nuclear factor subunit b13 n=1 Tax=Tetraselmis sp. GSL018 TaxID=582737 RepID=A0A061R4Q4_9CHLO|mmetsp:Transcript_866/g.2079  ORF Transcript_866/g.2079 Transcript_866/m.2079 type:complete len:149 (-) Transcript_866:142-588(-)|eukprot:CAMPEP_0177603620 /NCGR_PEP_ID=MMETSP0419_2-20121207/15620_1 /TAXON_ID=582737 /ORGANISM="Tetraselmis sp., Strain GSL018" /LENGTH=148 /DNA_ID=CAMNT_0019097425 /DNA_START=320 /DNA_END=766 /DNA_ORIENTATION=+